MTTSTTLFLLGALSHLCFAAPAQAPEPTLGKRQSTYSRIIAFGDDFTDNGQGSYAHGITGDLVTGAGAHLWGANTWTDGLTAASYLAQNLGVPLTYNYAFGSSGGGDKVGSVCDNAAIPSNQLGSHAKLLNGQLVPDAISQVKNYTNGQFSKTDIADTLHFFWTGNDDMIPSLGWVGRFTICDKDTLCHPGQQTFITKLVQCIENQLTTLIKAGAQHIIVPNIYPKQFSPWQLQYISSAPGMIEDFGGVITQTNAQLETMIQQLNRQHGTNVLYFDAYTFLRRALHHPIMVQGAKYNSTCPDGCTKMVSTTQTNWAIYWAQKVLGGKADPFYWMTTNMISTTVHKELASRMVTALLH